MTPPPTVRPRRALTMTSRALLRMTSQALLMVRQTKGGGGDDSGDARRAGPARRHRDRNRRLGADRRGDPSGLLPRRGPAARAGERGDHDRPADLHGY